MRPCELYRKELRLAALRASIISQIFSPPTEDLLVPIASYAILHLLQQNRTLDKGYDPRRRRVRIKPTIQTLKLIRICTQTARFRLRNPMFDVYIQRTPSSHLHTLADHVHGKVDILCRKLYLSIYSLFTKCMKLPLKRASLRSQTDARTVAETKPLTSHTSRRLLCACPSWLPRI